MMLAGLKDHFTVLFFGRIRVSSMNVICPCLLVEPLYSIWLRFGSMASDGRLASKRLRTVRAMSHAFVAVDTRNRAKDDPTKCLVVGTSVHARRPSCCTS